MTVIASIHVSESLQTLIDCRLDTIDRMLLGRLPRSERVEIVREVEAQIFELLGERTSDEITREDVLAVLARLDPPEAYLPEDMETEPRRRPMTGQPPARPRISTSSNQNPRVAKASGVLGIVTVVLSVLLFPMLFVFASAVSSSVGPILVFWITFAGLGIVGSITGIVMAIHARLRGAWAITGLCTSILALLICLAGSLLVLLDYV
jgi:hypothetical protein